MTLFFGYYEAQSGNRVQKTVHEDDKLWLQ